MKEVKVFLQRCILVACEINKLNLTVTTTKDAADQNRQNLKQQSPQKKSESTNSLPQKQPGLNREQNNRIIALRKQLSDAENKLSQKETTLKQLGPENAMLKEKLKASSKASQETEKLYQKYHNIVSLYNKLTSEYKCQKRELESLKSSQSSGAFINKIKKEVEDHLSTKSNLSELTAKYDTLLKEHEILKRNHLKSIISTPNQLGNAEETISSPSKGESNEQNSTSSKNGVQNNLNFVEVLEKADITSIPPEIIEAFKAEIKRRDDQIRSLNQDNEDLVQQLKDSNSDLDKIQEDNDVARRFNSSVTEQNLKLKAENVKFGEKIASLLEQIDEMSRDFRKSCDESDYKIENLQKSNAELVHTNNGLQYELSQQEVNRRRDQCSCTSAKNSIQTQNQVINELRSQLSDLKTKLQMHEDKQINPAINGNSANDHFSPMSNKNNDTYSSEHLTNRLVELNAEIEMKDKLVRFFMTGYPDIDLSNFFNGGKNMTQASFVNIYNESITKMQKILEEQLLKNIDLDQNLSRTILENSLLNEELEKARAILNAK